MTVTDNATLNNGIATDESDVNVEKTETQTVGEWFNSLARGTYLTSGWNTLIYVGDAWDGGVGGYVPRVINTRYWDVTNLSRSVDLPKGDDWFVIYTDDEGTNPKVADEDTLRLVIEYCGLKDRSKDLGQRLSDVESKAYHLEDDWRTLNVALNEYADNNSMCSDYERQLDEWNEQFVQAKLAGRPRNWTVGVKCEELWDGTAYINIMATSPAEANETVGKLSKAELLLKVIESDSVSLLVEGDVKVTIDAY